MKSEPPDVIYTENYDTYMCRYDDVYNNLLIKRDDIMHRIAKRENISTFNIDDFIYGDIKSINFSEESEFDLKTYFSLHALLLKRKDYLKKFKN